MLNLISWTGWTKEDWIENLTWCLVGVTIGLSLVTAFLIFLLML